MQSIGHGKGRRAGGVVMAAGMVAAIALPVAGRLAAEPGSPVSPTAAAKPAAPSLPVVFEPNVGQAAPGVGYLARGTGLSLALSPTKANFTLGNAAKGEQSPASLSLLGADPQAKMVSTGLQQATSNYFIGNEPAKWHRNVPTYGKVISQGVYPGVNLAWYGAGKGGTGLEYDFMVAPGADPSPIALSVGGAESVEIDAKGDLVAHLAGGHTLRQHRPVAYQADGAGKRTPVEAAFRLDGDQVRFTLGAYDHGRELVIDPVVEWSTYFGQVWHEDGGNSLDLDAAGNLYLASATRSNVDTTDGTTNQNNQWDAFVAKFSPSGALLYATMMGGSRHDENTSAPDTLSVSPDGIVHVVGRTLSLDFPLVKPVDTCTTSFVLYDAFAFKLDPTGSTLLYSTCLGGQGQDRALGSALDSLGNLYLVGTTASKKFPSKNATNMGPGGKCLAHSVDPDPGDAFITKLGPKGALLFSSCWGGAGNDVANAVDVDADGFAYVVGSTDSSNFPEKRNAGIQTGRGNPSGTSGFVFKVTPKVLPGVKFSSYLQGDGGQDRLGSVDVAGDGQVYLGGTAGSTDFATKWPAAAAGAYQPAKAGGATDAFLARLRFEAAAPHALIMDRVTYLGGTADDSLADTALGVGGVWAAGLSASADFPLVGPLPPACDAGSPTVATLDDTLSTLSFSSCFGGSALAGGETAQGVTVDASGNAYLSGWTQSHDFPVTPGAYQTVCGDCNFAPDAWLAKLSPTP